MSEVQLEPTYRIRLAKEPFTFAAAHFITFAGDQCEPLHGHNYHVQVVLEGPLDENGYVRDFIATRDLIASITAKLDHVVLLPTKHPAIRVIETTHEGAPEVWATFEQRRWVFPAGDCQLLSIANTTAELLARWIAEQILLGMGDLPHGTFIEVEVDECDGQAGLCRLGGSR